MQHFFGCSILVLHDFVGIFTRASDVRITLEVYLLPFVLFYKIKGIYECYLMILTKYMISFSSLQYYFKSNERKKLKEEGREGTPKCSSMPFVHFLSNLLQSCAYVYQYINLCIFATKKERKKEQHRKNKRNK